VDAPFDPNADPAPHRRVKSATLPAAKRKESFAEVELCCLESEALREASRCLRCEFKEKK
jgi:NADH-quinone oxidoreductase subunit F